MRKPAALVEDTTLTGKGAGSDASADAIIVSTLGQLAQGFAAHRYDGIAAMYVEITRHPEPVAEDMISIRVRMWGTP